MDQEWRLVEGMLMQTLFVAGLLHRLRSRLRVRMSRSPRGSSCTFAAGGCWSGSCLVGGGAGSCSGCFARVRLLCAARKSQVCGGAKPWVASRSRISIRSGDLSVVRRLLNVVGTHTETIDSRMNPAAAASFAASE